MATCTGNAPVEVTKWAGAVVSAHDQVRDKPNPIGGCAWSPLGHVLVSYSTEVHVWARNKPGAIEEIRYQNDDAADIVIGGAGGAADGAVLWT